MPRFAILTHDHPFLHWDLLLEQEAAAWTWRLLEEPHAGEIPVERIANHRLLYLDYEGPVSGNRGQVTQWDAGTYEILDTSPLTVKLTGRRLNAVAHFSDGTLTLHFLTEPTA